jgi:hypothetical protein
MTDQPHGFYSDCVDIDGTVIATVTVTNVRCSWAPDFKMIKLPAAEMVLPDDAPHFRIGGPS